MVGRKKGNEDKGNVNLVTRRPVGVSAVMVILLSIPTPETGVVGETLQITPPRCHSLAVEPFHDSSRIPERFNGPFILNVKLFYNTEPCLEL